MKNGLTTVSVPMPAEAGEEFVHARKAMMSDIGGVLRLINGYASLGMMLPRTEFELSESIRDFTVIQAGDQMVGCGALHFYSPTAGEIRSLAVDSHWKTRGIGRRLMAALEEEAAANGLHSIFAFTYVPGFFGKLGFREVDRGELPSKVWKDCLRCPKFQCCDEVAMRKILQPESGGQPTPPICGENERAENGADATVLLPAVIRK